MRVWVPFVNNLVPWTVRVVDDVFVFIFTEFSQIQYIECFIVAGFCIFQISTYLDKVAVIASVSECIHQTVWICCSVTCCSLVNRLYPP